MALTFNGAARLILRDDAGDLSVRALWSEWVRWHATGDNGKFPMAFRLLGGDQIDPVQGTAVPFYVYMQNGWAIRPHEADHAFANPSNAVFDRDATSSAWEVVLEFYRATLLE